MFSLDVLLPFLYSTILFLLYLLLALYFLYKNERNYHKDIIKIYNEKENSYKEYIKELYEIINNKNK